MEQTGQGDRLPLTPDVHRAIVREIKLRLLQRLREDGRITGEEYDRLTAGYRTDGQWDS